jgi:hypothetical protein
MFSVYFYVLKLGSEVSQDISDVAAIQLGWKSIFF